MAERKDADAAAVPPVVEKKHDAGTCDSCGAPVDGEGKYAAPAMDACEPDVAKMDSLRGQVDAKEAEIAGLRKRLDEANDPKRIAALVGEAVAVRAIAERACVERADSLDTSGLRLAVIEKVTGLRCDDKSPDYVAGLFDAAVKQLDRNATNAVRSTVEAPRADANEPPLTLIEQFRISMEESQKHNTKGGR